MAFELKITPKAFNDLEYAIDYYDHQQKGLGKRFGTAIKNSIDSILSAPMAASFAFDEVRYKVVNRFPYVLLYSIKGNNIVILRVFNTHQEL